MNNIYTLKELSKLKYISLPVAQEAKRENKNLSIQLSIFLNKANININIFIFLLAAKNRYLIERDTDTQ
jgi:hypothetical protein